MGYDGVVSRSPLPLMVTAIRIQFAVITTVVEVGTTQHQEADRTTNSCYHPTFSQEAVDSWLKLTWLRSLLGLDYTLSWIWISWSRVLREPFCEQRVFQVHIWLYIIILKMIQFSSAVWVPVANCIWRYVSLSQKSGSPYFCAPMHFT